MRIYRRAVYINKQLSYMSENNNDNNNNDSNGNGHNKNYTM